MQFYVVRCSCSEHLEVKSTSIYVYISVQNMHIQGGAPPSICIANSARRRFCIEIYSQQTSKETCVHKVVWRLLGAEGESKKCAGLCSESETRLSDCSERGELAAECPWMSDEMRYTYHSNVGGRWRYTHQHVLFSLSRNVNHVPNSNFTLHKQAAKLSHWFYAHPCIHYLGACCWLIGFITFFWLLWY